MRRSSALRALARTLVRSDSICEHEFQFGTHPAHVGQRTAHAIFPIFGDHHGKKSKTACDMYVLHVHVGSLQKAGTISGAIIGSTSCRFHRSRAAGTTSIECVNRLESPLEFRGCQPIDTSHPLCAIKGAGKLFNALAWTTKQSFNPRRTGPKITGRHSRPSI